MRSLLLISLLLSPSLSHLSESFIHSEFLSFQSKFNKLYTSSESSSRYHIFSENLRYIDSVNSEDLPFKLKVGPFADLTYKEFESSYLRPPVLRSTADFDEHINVLNVSSLPASVNWQDAGKVTPPMNQLNCSSSYILASLASVESAYAIMMSNAPGNNLIPLSEQQVLDCAGYKGLGCSGGSGYEVLDYLMGVPCIARYRKYPYTGVERKCKASKVKAGCTKVDVGGWFAVPPNNELQLMAAVASNL